MAGGSVHIPWYATGFRGDKLEAALADIAPVALRYGASSYGVYRYKDDRYKFLQTATFERKEDWERYWGGPEFQRMRTVCQSWYQIPLLYGWADVVAVGSMPEAPVVGGEPAAIGGAQGDTGDTM